ncbi:MAG: archease [Planctomycetota bacterium]
MKNYEMISHTADIGILVRGKDLKSLFTNAGEALIDILTDRRKIALKETINITVNAERLDDLMNYWLSELLQHLTVKGKLLTRFEIDSISENKIVARVQGEPYDEKKHQIKTEIKAVTFHDLFVRQENNRWVAQVIFDV